METLIMIMQSLCITWALDNYIRALKQNKPMYVGIMYLLCAVINIYGLLSTVF